jgi:glycerophosphoryl diester phosphodiesterase
MVQQRLPSLLDPPIGFAHRGARAHAPENTMEAFDLAIRLGATGLESDAWLTADGEIVLDHDGVVGGRLRRRPITEVLCAQLPESIPALSQLLLAHGLEQQLSLDVKDVAAARPIIEMVHRLLPDRAEAIWLCHPDHRVLADLIEEAGGINLVHSTRLNRLETSPEMHAATLARIGIRAVNLHHTEWSGGLVALFHRFGVVTFGWDMQFEHILRTGLRMGLDGVFSDHVDVMVDAFRAEIGGV